MRSFMILCHLFNCLHETVFPLGSRAITLIREVPSSNLGWPPVIITEIFSGIPESFYADARIVLGSATIAPP
jgi:hypothetical protein